MEKVNTKEQILAVALDLFSIRGYEAISISQIADAVGLQKASLYSHFASKDVWHDGRFIDKWAGESIVHELEKCFAHYDKQDVWNALVATNKLFEKVTREIAEGKGYAYPDKAANCAKNYLKM